MIAGAFFTPTLIFVLSWFETIYTHLLIIYVKPFSINFKWNLFRMRRCCHFYTLQNDQFRQYYKQKQQRTQ